MDVITATGDHELLDKSFEMASQYEMYKVFDNTTLLAADQDLTAIKKHRNAIEESRLKLSRKMDETKIDVMKPYVDAVGRLDGVRDVINKEISSFKRAQEAIRQEQERKLQEAARKEEERKRKELEARAAKAAASGKAEKAEELRAKKEEVFVPVPIVPSFVANTKNKPRDVWKYEVIDINAVPREYMCIDDKKTGQVVRATKGTLAIPGLRIYREDSKF